MAIRRTLVGAHITKDLNMNGLFLIKMPSMSLFQYKIAVYWKLIDFFLIVSLPHTKRTPPHYVDCGPLEERSKLIKRS